MDDKDDTTLGDEPDAAFSLSKRNGAIGHLDLERSCQVRPAIEES